jgi:YebC/PmpR family DNA-binding regulatory protein
MSGHSKWSQIKRQKGVTDARRGQLFTKLTKEIMLAVRQGGASPDSNFRLRLGIQKARDSNMPMENIERAIKRASGPGEGVDLTEITYEGYGPGGVALMVQVLTDNRNRALQEIRGVLARSGGTLGESGCVAWLFDPKGIITIQTEGSDAEETALAAIDAGAQDVKIVEGYVEIHAEPQELEAVRCALEEGGIAITSSEISTVPQNTVNLDEKQALQALKLLDRLEELDDVQRVFSNVDFSDEVLEKLRVHA